MFSYGGSFTQALRKTSGTKACVSPRQMRNKSVPDSLNAQTKYLTRLKAELGIAPDA